MGETERAVPERPVSHNHLGEMEDTFSKYKYTCIHHVEVEAGGGSPAPLVQDEADGAPEAGLEQRFVLGRDGGQLGAHEVNVPGEGGEDLGRGGEGDQRHVLQSAVGLYPGQQLGDALDNYKLVQHIMKENLITIKRYI